MIPEPTTADLLKPLEEDRNHWKAIAEELQQDIHRLTHAKLDLERQCEEAKHAAELEKRAHQETKDRQALLDQLLIDRERLRRERNDEGARATEAEREKFQLQKEVKRLEGELARALGKIQ